MNMENCQEQLLHEIEACLDIILKSPTQSGPQNNLLSRYAVLLQEFSKLSPNMQTQSFSVRCLHRIYATRVRYPFFWIDELELLTYREIA